MQICLSWAKSLKESLGQARGVALKDDIPDWVSTWENGQEGQGRVLRCHWPYEHSEGWGHGGGRCGTSTQHLSFLHLPSTPNSQCSPTSFRVSLCEDSEVNDTGGEVKGCLLATMDH